MYTLEDRQIGLGTFPFCGVFSPITQEEAENITAAFLDLGGHYIETAPSYPRNNVDMGKLIAKFPRQELLVGTKCVLDLDKDGNMYNSGKPETVRQQCLRELQRLGVDYLDLLEAHYTASDVSCTVVAQTLNELKKEGLVRYIGASNASVSDIEDYVAGGGIDYVQNRYSILHRSPTESIAPICRKHNIHFNPYQVIERGQLIDKNVTGGAWREGDLRHKKPEYSGDVFTLVRAWASETLGGIAREAGLSLEALSIRWAFSKPQVSMPVIGATKLWQLQSNMAAGTEALPADVLAAVDNSYGEFAACIQSTYGKSLEAFRGLGK